MIKLFYNKIKGKDGGEVFGRFSLNRENQTVTFYKRDYDRLPKDIFDELGIYYENSTDSQSDYFDEGHIRFIQVSPYYPEALKMTLKYALKCQVHYLKTLEKYPERNGDYEQSQIKRYKKEIETLELLINEIPEAPLEKKQEALIAVLEGA